MPLRLIFALGNANVHLVILDIYNRFVTHSNNFLVYIS